MFELLTDKKLDEVIIFCDEIRKQCVETQKRCEAWLAEFDVFTER